MPLNPKYISLLPNSSCQPQHDGSDDVVSDFPPCRIHESTPDPITPPTNLRKLTRLRRKRCSSPTESEESPLRLPPSQQPALGAKNILNTIQVTEQAKVRFSFLVGGDMILMKLVGVGCSKFSV